MSYTNSERSTSFDGTFDVDEFGRPTGRNYRYRVSIDNTRALRIARVADKLGCRWVNIDYTADDLPYGMLYIYTRDNRGHLPGLAKFAHSPAWEKFPGGPGRLEGLEMRNASKGGTRLRGSVYAGFDIDGWEISYVDIDMTVSATPSEIKAAYNDGENFDEVSAEIEDAVFWALDDRYEEILEEKYEHDRELAEEHGCDIEEVWQYY